MKIIGQSQTKWNTGLYLSWFSKKKNQEKKQQFKNTYLNTEHSNRHTNEAQFNLKCIKSVK